MTLLSETTYAFINNNLQDKSAPKYEVIPNETSEYLKESTTHHFVKQPTSKGPSERKLRLHRNCFSRIRSSRNVCEGGDIQLRHVHPCTPDINLYNRHSVHNTSFPPSSSTTSSRSSSLSSRQLSPTTTPKAPLLGTNHKRNFNKNRIFKDHLCVDNVSSQQMHPCNDLYKESGESKPHTHTYYSNNLTNKLYSPPISNFKMKARRVWNVFERKMSNSKGISQSKSVGNLEYTSSALRTPDYHIQSNKEPDLSRLQMNKPRSETKKECTPSAHNESNGWSFPHSKSFDASVHLGDRDEIHETVCYKYMSPQWKSLVDNYYPAMRTEECCGRDVTSHLNTSHIMVPCTNSRNPTYFFHEDLTQN
ncbi:unnamed protein product [Heterobilharzia americana]|nr:unnamed protein product [Heterobilharzia americana]